MVKSNRNQCANAKNPFQGDYKKVLCVCSAGLLRSPTIARVLTKEYGFNTRACGVSEEYALIPINTALLYWADEIVFADHEHYNAVKDQLQEQGIIEDKVVILSLPDNFEYMDSTLVRLIKERYEDGAKRNKNEE